MIYPSIDELLQRVDSKYTLVIAAAKRGRQLRDGATPTIDCDSRKEVTVALHELNEGKVEIEPPPCCGRSGSNR
ncbi:MAG: DNA-directed RNA polymerase subunit omega [Dethiobacteria bacterium]|nr:DNA-directed RNA polymerase subunit omega [Bacillota bacterium]